MEKTCRDFLKLEGKIYDMESTNPRFFASEGWVQHYEKDKNVVLAALDQYKANIIRMEHLYTVVDNNSYEGLLNIPNQDDREYFNTKVMWTSRSLKDWANNWFIKRGNVSCTKLFTKDYWVPGLTGQMVEWMKLGTYNEFNMRPIANETMIRKVDLLEGVIDRLMSDEAVQNTISKFLTVKETIEQEADQSKEKIFTSKIIDSQMGKKLGVTNSGITNEKKGATFISPKKDQVENFNLVCKLSCVKKLFKQLREQSLDTMKTSRCVSSSGPGPYPTIWCEIEKLANPVYSDLSIMAQLIEDQLGDSENPGKHCSITNVKLCPTQLKKHITAFKCIIQDGVIDVMLNQALLPKKGRNILDSMFNQLWEYGEKGPTLELPTWCQMAIDNINAFEDSMLDAWDEVYDCWEREFITRLWRIQLEHHGGGMGYPKNWVRKQDESVETRHNHVHQLPGGAVIMSPGPTCPESEGSPTTPVYVNQTVMTTDASPNNWDTYNFDTTDLVGHFTCPGHRALLLAPVCVAYRTGPIAHLSKNYRPDVKELCQWMCAAIEAIGLKQAAISAVMSDPTLNGKCKNDTYLSMINDLREKNHKLLSKVEEAYGIYSDVKNMKNKKEYDEEIALHELQPNKFSNEDQMNMGSSIQSETKESTLDAELCQGGIDIKELKPWNHLDLSENHVKPEELPAKCACNKFEKIIKSLSSFESMFNME